MKKILYILPVFLFFLTIIPSVHAVTPPAPGIGTSTQSDFAKDLQEGKQATAHDNDTQKSQKTTEANETLQAGEQGETQNPQDIDQQDLDNSNDSVEDQKQGSHSAETKTGTNSAKETQEQDTRGGMQEINQKNL